MSTPPFDPDDPRLTAYVLGEADEADRHTVEEILAQSPGARVDLEQTRALARALADGYTQENERYIESRTRPVALPFARQRRWRPTVTSLLKAAAVLALTASLAFLGLRSSRRTTVTVASAPPPSMPAPPPAAPKPLADERETVNTGPGSPERSAQTTVATAPPDSGQAATAPMPAPATPDTLLAMENQRATVLSKARSPVGQAAVIAPAAAPAASTMSRQTYALRPGAGDAMDKLTTATAAAESSGHPVVRVRAANGRFFAGVVLSANGLILSFSNLPGDVMKRPCAVLLADQREFTAAAEPSPLGDGWYWLRIAATGLSATTLDKGFSAVDATPAVAAVDPQSGELSFSPLGIGKSDSTGDSAGSQPNAAGSVFAFSKTGGLLVVHPTPPTAGVADAVKRTAPTKPSPARPFTPGEREIIQRAIRSSQASK